jgi:hypothetical protein
LTLGSATTSSMRCGVSLTADICDPWDVTARRGRLSVVMWRAAAIVCDRWMVWRKGGEMVVAELAVTAANALVQAMVTDGWEGVRRKVARLFGRGTPDRKIEERLEAARAELVAASPADVAKVQAEVEDRWANRLAVLLDDYPSAEPELAALVKEIRASLPAASDHSVAAGRDNIAMADRGGVAAAVIHGDVSTGPTRPGPVSS